MPDIVKAPLETTDSRVAKYELRVIFKDISDNVPKVVWRINRQPLERIVSCCGCAKVGTPLYISQSWSEDSIAKWETPYAIVVGYVDKQNTFVKPVGKEFIRVPGPTKDFVLAWSNT